MEDLGSIWSYESIVDQLKQKLLSKTRELESLRGDVNVLMNLLEIASAERDEAKNQVQKLLNKLEMPSPSEFNPLFSPQSPLLFPNSSFTESSSLSDSFIDVAAVTSPEFSSINNIADSTHIGFFKKTDPVDAAAYAGLIKETDRADAVIERLIKNRVLPQKGKLLQSVMESGPLLQTVLLAGPLPHWRIPPPLRNFKIPAVGIRGCKNEMTFQSGTTSVMNFAAPGSSSNIGHRWSLSSGCIGQVLDAKRQRLQ